MLFVLLRTILSVKEKLTYLEFKKLSRRLITWFDKFSRIFYTTKVLLCSRIVVVTDLESSVFSVWN